MLPGSDPATGKVEEWASPGGPASKPYGIATRPDGMVWYSESGVTPNTIVKFEPSIHRLLPAAHSVRRRRRAQHGLDSRGRPLYCLQRGKQGGHSKGSVLLVATLPRG